MSRSPSPRELASTLLGRLVLGLLGGGMIGAIAVVGGQMTGLLPLGEPRTLRAPCRDASITALVPGGEVVRDEGGRTTANCRAQVPSPRYTHLDVKVEKAWTAGMAEADHRRGCESLTALGPVGRPPGLGDESCLVTDRGMLPATTVLARHGAVRVTVRYTSAAKDPATVERDAVTAARRVTASL